MITWCIANWRLIAVALIAVALFGGGWRIGSVMTAADYEQALKSARDKAESARIKLSKLSSELVAKESRHEEKVRTEIRYITRTIAAAPVTGCLDADGVRLWNRASEASGQADKPDGAVQPAVEAGR